MLSNQAIPNQLSTTGGAGATLPTTGGTGATPPTTGPATPSTRPVATRPTSPAGPPAQPPEDGAARRPRRLPSLSSLLFIGFLVFSAVRFFNSTGADEADPTTVPRQTAAAPQSTPPRPTTSRGPAATQGQVGTVTFGTSLGDECALTGGADTFQETAAVWWRADLEYTQPPDADALVLTFRDSIQVDREFVPADPAYGEWSVLCAATPTKGTFNGTYRVEVWNGDRSVLLASGEFTRSP